MKCPNKYCKNELNESDLTSSEDGMRVRTMCIRCNQEVTIQATIGARCAGHCSQCDGLEKHLITECDECKKHYPSGYFTECPHCRIKKEDEAPWKWEDS